MIHGQAVVRRRPRDESAPAALAACVQRPARARQRWIIGRQAGVVLPKPVEPVAPPLPKWWYAIDPAGSPDADGVVFVQCAALPPNAPVVFVYPAGKTASIRGLRILTTINGMPHTRVRTFKPINVVTGDSIQFTYTLTLETLVVD